MKKTITFQPKKSRRELAKEAGLSQTLLRTLAAILIEEDGWLVVKRENLLMASQLMVDARQDEHGNVMLRLKTEDGEFLNDTPQLGAPTNADQPVHESTGRELQDGVDVDGGDQAVSGVRGPAENLRLANRVQ